MLILFDSVLPFDENFIHHRGTLYVFKISVLFINNKMLRLEKTPLPYFLNEEPMTQRKNISFLRWGFPKCDKKKL